MKIELYAVVQDVISKARWGWIVSIVGVSVINTFQAALGCTLCQIQEFPCEYWGRQELEESLRSLIPLICSSEAGWRDAAAGRVGNRCVRSPHPGKQSLACFPCSLRSVVPGSAAVRAWPALLHPKTIKMTVKRMGSQNGPEDPAEV